MLSAIGDRYPDVVYAAVGALVALEVDTWRIIERLQRAVADQDPEIREAGAVALGWLGEVSTRPRVKDDVMGRLERLLEAEILEHVRRAATGALKRLRGSGVEKPLVRGG